MTLKNPKQFNPKNIPLQIRSLGTRALFWSPANLNNCRNFSCFDTAETKVSSYAPQLITIYFVIMVFKALKYHKQHDAE
jgi:hypothetical protein